MRHTWRGTISPGVVFSKLDRAFCNDQYLDLWAQVNCLCLHRLCSDHHPLLLDYWCDVIDAILIRQHVWFDICMCAVKCFA